MRYLVYTLAIVMLCALVANAAENPVDKGCFNLDGVFSYSSHSMVDVEDADDLTFMTLTSNIGYFIAPGIRIGSAVNYSQVKFGEMKVTISGFGPSIAYYFNSDDSRLEAKGAIYPYVQGFYMFAGNIKVEADMSDIDPSLDPEETKINVTSYGGRGGIVYMMSNSVGLDLSVSYARDEMEPDDPPEGSEPTKFNTLMFGAGVSAFIF
ncbi:MAG: hypothetical protein KAT79_04720 [candidate division Zixibacteria bacterium]|nr:hypothetical protein [candidate division Zixibacteria bacterium]